eukprot:753884-Hanusia_phi.AAC.6
MLSGAQWPASCRVLLMCATVIAADRSLTSSSSYSSTSHALSRAAFVPQLSHPLQRLRSNLPRNVCSSMRMKDTVTVIGASTSVGKRLTSELLKEQEFSLNLCFDKYSDAMSHANNPLARCYVGNIAQTRGDLKVLQVSSSGENRMIDFDTILGSSDAIVVSESTSCFPSVDWLLGRSPTDLNVKLLHNVAKGCSPRVKKIVLLSALGARRNLTRLPKLDANILFWCNILPSGRTVSDRDRCRILNIFGALDAIREGEQIICRTGQRLSVPTSIIRAKLHCYMSGPFGGMDEVDQGNPRHAMKSCCRSCLKSFSTNHLSCFQETSQMERLRVMFEVGVPEHLGRRVIFQPPSL